MFKRRFTRPFRRLRGKLTLSYTLTSVVTFLVIELIILLIVLWFLTADVSGVVLNNFKQQAPQAAPYFVHGSADREALTSWLQILDANAPNTDPYHFRPIFLTVVDPQGQIIVSVGTQPMSADTPIQAQLSPQNVTNLHAVLNDINGTTSNINQDANDTLVAIAPIVGPGNSVWGALILKVAQPNTLKLFFDFLQAIVLSVVVVTTIAAIAGLIFGYLNTRDLIRRLRGLSAAADSWGKGNFSAHIHDSSEDELGQAARQFNRMAEQLQNLLSARQKLATLEERNRLARDLHDSVKQEIFAVAMQIGATKVLLKRDPNAAEVRLKEAEKLIHQAQQELTSLIRELRPVALEGKGLVAALRELATQWTQQTEIVANLRVEGTHTLSLTVEEALFRVAQEALANAAHHSKANLVQMTLMMSDDTVTLSLVDNGKGFDTARQGLLGVGLLSMRERMKALGGDVQVESTPGKGTRIVAHCNRVGFGTSDATVATVTTVEPPVEDAKGPTPTEDVTPQS